MISRDIGTTYNHQFWNGSGEDFYSVKGKRYIIHPSEIFIWDLSLIFPDVKFEDNEGSITDDVIKVSISTEITEWGTKIE